MFLLLDYCVTSQCKTIRVPYPLQCKVTKSNTMLRDLVISLYWPARHLLQMFLSTWEELLEQRKINSCLQNREEVTVKAIVVDCHYSIPLLPVCYKSKEES